MAVAVPPITKKIVMHVDYDEWAENPLENDEGLWKFVPFGRDYRNAEPRDAYFTTSKDGRSTIPATPDVLFKMRKGLLFPLSVYSHSGEHWFMGNGRDHDFDYGGWDTTRCAGVLVWDKPEGEMGATTPQARKEDAQGTLDTLNDYLSGAVYSYLICDEEDDEPLDSCCGFVGNEYAKEAFIEELANYAPCAVKITGKAADLLHGEYLGAGITEVDDFDPADDEDVGEDICDL